MIEIIPAILAKTTEEYFEKMAEIESLVAHVHIDIADGIFVKNKTIDGIHEIEDISNDLNTTVHLMVSKPENHITRWADTPIDQIVFHIESTSVASRVVDVIKTNDKLAGVAINPNTEVGALDPVLNEIDFVHFMTVDPGFYGGEFKPDVLEKIKNFHYYYPDMPVHVDGAVTPANTKELIEAGASVLVSGSYVFKSGNAEKALDEFERVISSVEKDNV